MVFNIITITIAVIALIISICDIINNNKINKINLNSSTCDKIFDKYLIKEIPEARKLIKFDSKNKFTGADNLKKVLNNLLFDMLYFNYNDEKFYKKLRTKIQELEDYIVTNIDRKFESTQHAEVHTKIDLDLTAIYSLINNKKLKGKL